MHGRRRPFSIVFDPFHINRITAVSCCTVSECKRSDTAFSHRIRPFSAVCDTVKYGHNTVHMKRVKYGPFTVINDSIRDGFQRIRSPLSLSWGSMIPFLMYAVLYVRVYYQQIPANDRIPPLADNQQYFTFSTNARRLFNVIVNRLARLYNVFH